MTFQSVETHQIWMEIRINYANNLLYIRKQQQLMLGNTWWWLILIQWGHVYPKQIIQN